MPSITGITILFLYTLAFSNGFRNYFDYSDCNMVCQQQNQSCLLRIMNSQFESTCELSNTQCSLSADRSAVCLRKDLPPVGGEDIWKLYRKGHPKPRPIPNDVTMQTNITLYISIILNVIMTITILSILYAVRNQLRPGYELIPEAPANPSPTPTFDDITP